MWNTIMNRIGSSLSGCCQVYDGIKRPKKTSTQIKVNNQNDLEQLSKISIKQINGMKREMKFRAWDKAYNNMWGNKQSCEMLMRQAIFSDLGLADNTGCNYGDFVIFMQFTGSSDKNGKEIYEGDIVGINDRTPIGKIVWSNFNAQFIMLGKTFEQNMSYTRENYIVVGNIYENPELLK